MLKITQLTQNSVQSKSSLSTKNCWSIAFRQLGFTHTKFSSVLGVDMSCQNRFVDPLAIAHPAFDTARLGCSNGGAPRAGVLLCFYVLETRCLNDLGTSGFRKPLPNVLFSSTCRASHYSWCVPKLEPFDATHEHSKERMAATSL